MRRSIQCRYVAVKNALLHLMVAEGKPNTRPVVFLHGLGDSSLAFREAFDQNALSDHTLLVLDLPGHGRSAPLKDYSLAEQAEILSLLVAELGLGPCHLVGHSFGADIATIMALHDDKFISIANVEGHLTGDDVTILEHAVIAEADGRLDGWFHNMFSDGVVFEAAIKSIACRRYYASLQFCDPAVFAANAREILTYLGHCNSATWTQIGSDFLNISRRKVFIYGSMSLAQRTVEQLRSRAVPLAEIANAYHWPMIDEAHAFYGILACFISGTELTT